MNENEPIDPPRAWAGFALAGIIVGFAAQPLFRFADPSMLMGGGLLLGIAMVGVNQAWRMPTRLEQNAAMIVSLLGGALGALMLFATQDIARGSSGANDSRCLAIQRDMLSAKPRRADSPDLFQALGCRPQGEGSVYAPPSR